MLDKKIIVNADDLGISQGINSGIVEAFRKGIVTSASIMANANYTEDALSRLRDAPGLKVGIHITLSGSKPIADRKDVPHLITSEGLFLKRGLNLCGRLSISPAKVLNEIKKEISLQIEYLYSRNLKITHIDSHDHIHFLPAILDIIIEAAKKYSIPRIRFPMKSLICRKGSLISISKARILDVFISMSKNKIKESGLLYTDYLFGLAESGNLTEENLGLILNSLPNGSSEIMCHPGLLDENILKIFPCIYNWQKELCALTSPKIKLLIKELGIEINHDLIKT